MRQPRIVGPERGPSNGRWLLASDPDGATMFHDSELGQSAKVVHPVPDRTDDAFAAFVSGPGDITGLVAFALHERHAREWREQMQKTCGRPATQAEIRAHQIGETTPRRILAYRFLAAEQLAGRGSDVAPRCAFNDDPVFALFCNSEHDFVGVIAYAIHEQQVLEWREGMSRAFGRDATEDEIRAHRVSETTPRRILAYRFLASERLAGRGPNLTPGVAKVSFIARALGAWENEARRLVRPGQPKRT